jgi:O-antigen/teichoic acid export membrane protein
VPKAADSLSSRPLPPVLGRLLSGTWWLALRMPLQAVFILWSLRLTVDYIGEDSFGAYGFAWGFGFLQFLLEFGMSSALQRQVSERWTHGDRGGVNRAIACGTTFYAVVALVQAASLVGVAYLVLPQLEYRGKAYELIVKLLWLQALTAPCYGLSTVVSSILQAARRYDFIPRLEFMIVIVRFVILVAGLKAGFDFFLVVVAQTVAQVVLSLGPALWVMVRELGYVPHFSGVRIADFADLIQVSSYVFLIQLSVVLADKIDTTVLGFALSLLHQAPGPPTAVYQVVSKPFLQIRQAGWMLAYLVMPAVASLAAARDELGLQRIKYDGSRLLIGLLLPVALLAWIYAAPFLTLWMGPDFGAQAHLMRLFLMATIPLLISVHVQMAIGMNKIKVIALAALAGSLINLPLSFWLTLRLGVAGVIWGTVLTTLISNLFVPGIYVFRVLRIHLPLFLTRTLGAPGCGAAALIMVTWLFRWVVSPDPHGTTVVTRSLPLLLHLSLGCLAYMAGYLATPTGRADFSALARKLVQQHKAA